MQKITPFLWFNDNAEEAVNFYTSVFAAAPGGRDSKIGSVSRYDEEGAKASGRPKGSVMTASFRLFGQEFVALNGGPHFKFTEALSFVINCETQEEIDYYWEKLSEGADKNAQQCGWLKDKFGLSWQVVPAILGKLLQDKDAEKSKRVMHAMLQMKKIDIAKLEQAAAKQMAV
jgi:predicted 3-demethylubiquinone-9 3-methyltransferase (glyoxalase superfamily)